MNVGQTVLDLHKDGTVKAEVTHDTGHSHIKLSR
jgi:hypothetical protein